MQTASFPALWYDTHTYFAEVEVELEVEVEVELEVEVFLHLVYKKATWRMLRY